MPLFRPALALQKATQISRQLSGRRPYGNSTPFPLTGKLVHQTQDGTIHTEQVFIYHGMTEDDSIIFSGRVGHILQGKSADEAQCAYSMLFFHESQTFAQKSPHDIPRLEISRNFPQQTETNISQATLYLSAKNYMAALDSTDEAKFAAISGEIGRQLKPVLEKLALM